MKDRKNQKLNHIDETLIGNNIGNTGHFCRRLSRTIIQIIAN